MSTPEDADVAWLLDPHALFDCEGGWRTRRAIATRLVAALAAEGRLREALSAFVSRAGSSDGDMSDRPMCVFCGGEYVGRFEDPERKIAHREGCVLANAKAVLQAAPIPSAAPDDEENAPDA